MPKKEEAKALGATNFVVSSDQDEMKKAQKSLHMIYDSIAAAHPLTPYLSCLKRDGSYVMVGGVPTPMTDVVPFHIIAQRLKLGGSLIGGIKETQEMLDFCSKHNITSDIELIKAECGEVDTAWNRAIAGDVKFRFVIDTAATLKE